MGLRILCTLAALLCSAAARGEDAPLPPPASVAGPDFADVFDFSQAARPRPGDWLEYRVAFPADPLESGLNQNAAANAAPGSSAGAGTSTGSGGVDFEALARLEPLFEPKASWVVEPVRVQIREVFADGCNAEVTFAGETRTVRLAAADGAQADFRYDSGAEAERVVRLSGQEYTVQEIRRAGSDYGFVRWFSAAVPFGTVRFATEHVDIQLVALGRGAPPVFPVDSEAAVEPAMGELY